MDDKYAQITLALTIIIMTLFIAFSFATGGWDTTDKSIAATVVESTGCADASDAVPAEATDASYPSAYPRRSPAGRSACPSADPPPVKH